MEQQTSLPGAEQSKEDVSRMGGGVMGGQITPLPSRNRPSLHRPASAPLPHLSLLTCAYIGEIGVDEKIVKIPSGLNLNKIRSVELIFYPEQFPSSWACSKMYPS